jgi:tetratricopeptide (TPR) repeat protein
MEIMHSLLNRYFNIKLVIICALILAVIFVLLYQIHPAHADVAPPKFPPGANPSPDSEVTQVRMMDEKVVIEIQAEEDISVMGTARVWAEFHMLNLGDIKETLMVRFPTSYYDDFFYRSEIADLLVYIDNQSVPTSRLELEGEPEQWYDPVQWVEFEVVFPPGENVEIEVDYTLKSTGDYPFTKYGYLLETGAGWKGTIGSAEIIVRLPYKATAQTIFKECSLGWGCTTKGAYLKGNEVSWYFEDFEPARENNISIALVWPSAWYKVEQEKQNVRDFPNDGEAWGRLGKIYKDLIKNRMNLRKDDGGLELYQLSEEAYQHALQLLPDDALWHAGYADLLWWNWRRYYFNDSEEGWDDLFRGLEEIHTAYQLDPDLPYIQDSLSYWTYFPKGAIKKVDGEFVFCWLTQTPTLIVTQAPQATATQEIFPTETPVPVELEPTQPLPTAVEAEESGSTEEDGAGNRSLLIWGSMLLFLLILGVFIARSLLTSKRAEQ